MLGAASVKNAGGCDLIHTVDPADAHAARETSLLCKAVLLQGAQWLKMLQLWALTRDI